MAFFEADYNYMVVADSETVLALVEAVDVLGTVGSETEVGWVANMAEYFLAAFSFLTSNYFSSTHLMWKVT
jgi:hypothetical protein